MTRTGVIAVLDTSSLWSHRLRLELVDAAKADWYTAVWSDWIIGETYRILTLKWIERRGDSKPSLRALADASKLMMRAIGPIFSLEKALPPKGAPPWPELVQRDPDDVPIWNTAQAAGADIVVSENTNDYPPLVSGRAVHAGVEYLTPEEFLAGIGWPP